MRNLTWIPTLIAACLLTAAGRADTILFSEDFESYADTAALEAVWGPSTGAAELRTDVGHSGNSAFSPGGAVNQRTGFAAAPSATENVRLSFDLFDDGLNTTKRMTVGLRQAGGITPLFELGLYNSPVHYSTRILNLAGNENWLSLSATPVAGWHHFEALFTTTDVTVTLDLNDDGSTDFSHVSSGAFAANPFGDLRFGGPSGLASAGGGVFFDNISLSLVTIPEPGTWALFALGGLGLAGWCRRRR